MIISVRLNVYDIFLRIISRIRIIIQIKREGFIHINCFQGKIFFIKFEIRYYFLICILSGICYFMLISNWYNTAT